MLIKLPGQGAGRQSEMKGHTRWVLVIAGAKLISQLRQGVGWQSGTTGQVGRVLAKIEWQ